MTFQDPRQIIEKKRLSDGSELELKRWESDFISPGRIGYQLALAQFQGNLITQFPINWENYTEQQIREMYSSINSVGDFQKYQRNQKPEVF